MAETSGKRRPDPNVAQRQASDPTTSVWVTASAGTGKTQVLTNRTLRLMLGGAEPDQILCLTFTRAAASVMTNRIRDELATWATCDDKTLKEKLTHLTGHKPDEKTMTRARQLFTEFLDAHGDLRIQTIHSFSEALLRRFPIESGIPPYFDVMDDQSVAEMLRESQAEVLQAVGREPNSALAKAIGVVAPEVNEDDFINLISEITERRGQLKSIFKQNGGLEGTITAVYGYLGAPLGVSAQQMMTRLNAGEDLPGVSAPDINALKDVVDTLMGGSDAEKQKGMIMKAWIENPTQRVELFPAYSKIFLTSEGEIRKKLTTKATQDADDAMQREAQRLYRSFEAIRTLNVAQSTESLLRMTDAILEKYSEKKRSLNLLDYDDLVYHAGQMLKKDDHATSWVLEKLPGDLKHILVDEGQDTNPDQWQLVSSIVQEFYTNPARKKSKDCTIFVVGDEKQSIFSFQRADVEEFAKHKQLFADLVKKAGGKWRDVEMEIAFRSSPAITQAVDTVFATPWASDGLFHKDDADHKVAHDPYRRGQAGVVEIYPIDKPAEAPEPTPWSLPLQMEAANDPAVNLANKIADQIKGWLDSGEKLEARDRPINPADIMILVRRRSAFVDHMVRALKKRNIPVAGADRMSLREQIVVMDLVALGEVLLFPKDDYKLACVLKSPLIGMNDQQLEDLALGRKGDLWDALKEKAADEKADKVYKNALDYLEKLQNDVGTVRPYELYSSILLQNCPATGKSGVSTIYGRLGYEAEDPLVEFLNALEQFEKIHVPDLRGFLSWLEAGEAEVKREVNLNPEHPRVHIMTVHGAKGLEAPIVILPDTVGVPSDNPRARPRFLWPTDDRKVPLWAPKSDMENSVFKDERALAELERDREFRRLMYVAMTRAADRLYIYADHVPERNFEGSWYNLIRTGLLLNDKVEHIPVASNDDTPTEDAAPVDEKNVPVTLRLAVPQTARPVPDNVKPLEKDHVVGIPVWARTEAPSAQGTIERFRPSRGQEQGEPRVVPSPLESVEDNTYARALGTAVHALLEFLPVLPADEREAAAKDYLSKPELGITEQDQKDALANVTKLLTDPTFAPLFGPGSRPEVSISGYIERGGKKEIVNAAIDRLVVKDNSVLIVDFKNGRKVPKDASEVSEEYMLQLAAYKMVVEQIYPGKKVECALLYTREAKLIQLPADKMAEALKALELRKFTPPVAAKKPAGPKAA